MIEMTLGFEPPAGALDLFFVKTIEVCFLLIVVSDEFR